MLHAIAATLLIWQTSSLPPVQYVTSKDGTKIAYDVAGAGPVVILLHGGPRVEPAAMRCPTLWLVGTNNENAYASAKEYEGKLAGTMVTLLKVEGLNHPQEFSEIDRVFLREVEFTRTYAQ